MIGMLFVRSSEILPPRYDPEVEGKLIQFRDYQIDAIWYAIQRNRCLLLCPTVSEQVINHIHTCSILSFDES